MSNCKSSGFQVRTVFWNVGQNVIVLLYVCDNETNFMVKISIGIGLLIELWKITKVSDVSFDRENKYEASLYLKFWLYL